MIIFLLITLTFIYFLGGVATLFLQMFDEMVSNNNDSHTQMSCIVAFFAWPLVVISAIVKHFK